ncbi:MAG: hypothetical protein HeimC3_39590 [Candidatus Heimdallarchaeota archaeon LC_3]|nr:MAG: hypothetical protein HeimC3_39590 [Candidatus Heimdallarchaeota archaeon LC_3]
MNTTTKNQLSGSIIFFSSMITLWSFPENTFSLESSIGFIFVTSLIALIIGSSNIIKWLVILIGTMIISKNYDLDSKFSLNSIRSNYSKGLIDPITSKIYLIISFIITIIILSTKSIINTPLILNSDYSKFLIIISTGVIFIVLATLITQIKESTSIIRDITIFMDYSRLPQFQYSWIKDRSIQEKINLVVLNQRRDIINVLERYINQGDYIGFQRAIEALIISPVKSNAYSNIRKLLGFKYSSQITNGEQWYNELKAFPSKISDFLQDSGYYISRNDHNVIKECIKLGNHLPKFDELLNVINLIIIRKGTISIKSGWIPEIDQDIVKREAHSGQSFDVLLHKISFNQNGNLNNKILGEFINILKIISENKKLMKFLQSIPISVNIQVSDDGYIINNANISTINDGVKEFRLIDLFYFSIFMKIRDSGLEIEFRNVESIKGSLNFFEVSEYSIEQLKKLFFTLLKINYSRFYEYNKRYGNFDEFYRTLEKKLDDIKLIFQNIEKFAKELQINPLK